MSENIERLLMDLKESLERESQKTREEMHQRFGAIEQRLDRQSGMLVAGTRVLARFEEWSNAVDSKMSELEQRIRRLEDKQTT